MSSSKISAAGSAYSLTFLHPCQKPHHTAKEAKTSSHTHKRQDGVVLLLSTRIQVSIKCAQEKTERLYIWSVEFFPNNPLKTLENSDGPDPFLAQLGVGQAKRHTQISRFLFKVLPSLFTILPQMLTFLCPVAEWRPPWSSSSCLLGAEALVGAPG